MDNYLMGAALWMALLASQPVAAPQPVGPAASSPVYISASAALFTSPDVSSTIYSSTGNGSSRSYQSQCGASNSGTFCGRVGTAGPTAVFAIGGFITRRVALELEAIPFANRSGDGAYNGYSHIDTDKTTSILAHSERVFSALLRFRTAPHTRSTSIEPVVGISLAHSNEEMTARVRSYASCCNKPLIVVSLPDVTRSQSSLGMTLGLDVAAASGHAATFVVMTRLRWIWWPDVIAAPAAQRDTIPQLVNHATFVIGAGIRFGGHR